MEFPNLKIFKPFIGACLLAASFFAQGTLIHFDDLPTNSLVDDAYISDGVDFLTGDWVAATGFGETSGPNFAFSQSGNGSVNISNGFINQLNFTYGAFSTANVSLFSDVNGMGSLLVSSILSANNAANSFDSISIDFTGVARSIVIQGNAGDFAWDDLMFTAVPAISEPSILVLFGLGLIGFRLVKPRPVYSS